MPDRSAPRPVRTDTVLTVLRRVLRRLALTGLVVTALVSLVGYLVAGTPGLWGALIASAIGWAFMGITAASMYLMAGRGPELFQVVLLGGWLLKIALLILLLSWLRTEDFYHRWVFVAATAVVVIAGMAVETLTVVKARVPNVEPERTDPDARL